MPPVLTRVGPGLPCLHLLQSSALPCFHSLASLAGLLGAPGRHSVPVGEGPRATAVSACGAGRQTENLAMVSGEDARRHRQDEAVCEQI